jgi:putative YhgA-like transposase
LRLTPILPIVFYTGATPWNASREMPDLFAGPQELRAFAPQWPMLFWDLSAQDPQALLSSASAWLQALAIVRTEGEELATFETAFRQVCESLDRLKSSQRMRALDLLWFVLSWGMKRRPGGERQHLQEIARDSASEPAAREEVERMSKVLGETWEEEVSRRTNQMTLRKVIRMILERRVGPLPQSLADKLAACQEVDRLTELTSEALDVSSLDELRLE